MTVSRLLRLSDNGGGYYVSAVTITTGGTNYSPSTVIAVTSGGSPVAQASITPVITSGVITGTDIANAGQYGSNTPPTLTVTDTPVQATATIMLMPFGIQGTCVETYQSRAWVGNGPISISLQPAQSSTLILATVPGRLRRTIRSCGGSSLH